jgi:hypothetical protein
MSGIKPLGPFVNQFLVKIEQSGQVASRITALRSFKPNGALRFSAPPLHLLRELVSLGRDKALVEILPAKKIIGSSGHRCHLLRDVSGCDILERGEVNAPQLVIGEILPERRLKQHVYRNLAAQGMKVRAEMGVSGHARWFERLLSELLFFQLFMPWVGVLTRIYRLTN